MLLPVGGGLGAGVLHPARRGYRFEGPLGNWPLAPTAAGIKRIAVCSGSSQVPSGELKHWEGHVVWARATDWAAGFTSVSCQLRALARTVHADRWRGLWAAPRVSVTVDLHRAWQSRVQDLTAPDTQPGHSRSGTLNPSAPAPECEGSLTNLVSLWG